MNAVGSFLDFLFLDYPKYWIIYGLTLILAGLVALLPWALYLPSLGSDLSKESWFTRFLVKRYIARRRKASGGRPTVKLWEISDEHPLTRILRWKGFPKVLKGIGRFQKLLVAYAGFVLAIDVYTFALKPDLDSKLTETFRFHTQEPFQEAIKSWISARHPDANAYIHALKGTASLHSTAIQITCAALVLLGLYLDFKFPSELRSHLSLGHADKSERLTSIKSLAVHLLIALGLTFTLAPLYQPVITFMALAATVIAVEHLASLDEQGHSLSNQTRKIEQILNREGLEAWRQFLLRKIKENSSILGSVRFWDIDVDYLAFLQANQSDLEFSLARPCYLAILNRFLSSTQKSTDSLKDSLMERVRPSDPDPERYTRKITYLGFFPPGYRLETDSRQETGGRFPIFWPIGASSYNEGLNLVGCMYQLVLTNHFNRIVNHQRGDRYILIYISADQPWAYVVNPEGRNDHGSQATAFMLVEGTRESSDFAVDVTAGISGTTPFADDHVARGTPKAYERSRITNSISRTLRRNSMRRIPLSPSLLTYMLFNWPSGVGALSDALPSLVLKIESDSREIDRQAVTNPRQMPFPFEKLITSLSGSSNPISDAEAFEVGKRKLITYTLRWYLNVEMESAVNKLGFDGISSLSDHDVLLLRNL